MEEMKWSSSGFHGVLAANKLGFGLALLAEICQTFSQRQCQKGHKVKRTNVAILMVEQNAKQALNISDRGYVLVTGENKYSGTGQELLNDPRVRSSFLGG